MRLELFKYRENVWLFRNDGELVGSLNAPLDDDRFLERWDRNSSLDSRLIRVIALVYMRSVLL